MQRRVKKIYTSIKDSVTSEVSLSKAKQNEYRNILPNNPSVGKRDVFRENYGGRVVQCGKIQFNANDEKILILYKKLFQKYKMPSFDKFTRFSEFKEVECFIYFNTEKEEYYLNEFERISL